MTATTPEDMATCIRCKETKPKSDFNMDRRSSNGLTSCCRMCTIRRSQEWRENNPERVRANARARRLVVKVESLTHYGGVCACCGEADIRFLTFDHIHGGGNMHRGADAVVRGRLSYWLRTNGYPEGFQILCWNCNSARHINGGVCPHQDPGGRITCAGFQADPLGIAL